MTDIIAQRVRQAREWAGLTQNELADYLGVTRPMVTAIENGRASLTVENLLILHKVLDQPVEWFLGFNRFDLTDQESRLLALFRGLAPDERARLLDIVQAFVGAYRPKSD